MPFFHRFLAVLGFSVSSFGTLLAQDFTRLPVGVLPGSFGGSFQQSDGASALDGLSYGLNLDSTYQSNLDLQSDGGGGEFSLVAGANLSYRTGGGSGALLVGSFLYSPSYQEFFSDVDRPGAFSQSASASLAYGGNLISATLGATFSRGGASNRLAGGFEESTQASVNASVSWNYSPKTSLGLTSAYTTNSFGDGALSGSETVVFGVNASWQATPLFNVGPFLNFSDTSTDLAGSLQSVGFGANFSYELTGKTSLTASFGLQNQNFEQGGGGFSFVGNASANWQPNELYSVTLGLSSSTIAAPSLANQFINNYDFSLGVSRPLGAGNLSLNSSLSFSEFVATDEALQASENDKFLSINANYSRPIFFEEVSLNTSASYRKGFGGRDFASYTLSMGLGYSF